MDKFSELKAAASALKNMSDRKEKGLRTSTLQINAAAAKMRGMLTADAVLALLAELEAKDKRIAELEAEITNIVDSHGETVAELRAKLATPVRLPKRWDVTGQVNPPRIVEVQFEQQNRTHDQCAEAIRAAGFAVSEE